LAKIELEVPDNVMGFLKKFCDFTGLELKELLERELADLPKTMIGNWPGGDLYVSGEELLRHYKL